MLIQITKEFLINMDQVNYVKEFTDLGGGGSEKRFAKTDK